MDNGIDMRVFGMEPAGNVTRALLGEPSARSSPSERRTGPH
jgi:hypothetical protein